MNCCYLLLGLASFASFIHASHQHPVMPFSNKLSVVWLQLKPNPIAIVVDSSGRFIGTLPGNVLEPPARKEPSVQMPTSKRITPKPKPKPKSEVNNIVPPSRIEQKQKGKNNKIVPTARKITPDQKRRMANELQNEAATYITKTIQDSSAKVAEQTSPMKVQPPKKLVPIDNAKKQPVVGHRGMEITLTGKSVEISAWPGRSGKGKYSSTYPAEKVSPWKLTSIPKPKAIGVAPPQKKVGIIPRPIAISAVAKPKAALVAAAAPTTTTLAPTTTTLPETTTPLETTTEMPLTTTVLAETTTESPTTTGVPAGEAGEGPEFPPTTTPTPAEMYRFWRMMMSGGEMPEPGEGPMPNPEPVEAP